MAPVYRERGQRLTPGGQAILCHLADHPLDFRKEIRHALRMPNGTFQYHLQALEECGLLRPVRYRGKTYYRLLIRGAPRVAMFLERLGWDEKQPGASLAQLGEKIDEIHLAADRAILTLAARESASQLTGMREHYLALKSLLVL